jgi:hypothetical protein
MWFSPFAAERRFENLDLGLFVACCSAARTDAFLEQARTGSNIGNAVLVSAGILVSHVKFAWLDKKMAVNFVSQLGWQSKEPSKR